MTPNIIDRREVRVDRIEENSGLAEAIHTIHNGTAYYTALPEIETLLDLLGWPYSGSALLDPGAGDGGFLVAALKRLSLHERSADYAIARVHGYEFHPGAAQSARAAIAAYLRSLRWNRTLAARTAERMVETKDFLLSDVPNARWDVFAANPPYWRYANLPMAYRPAYNSLVPDHARADLLYAYLNRVSEVAAPNAKIGLVTADRWLLNSSSSELRRRLGERYSVQSFKRLDAASAFYHAKHRTIGSPPRVHPVSLVLTTSREGQSLTQNAFALDPLPTPKGIPLSSIATVRLAPWLGPDGIFIVKYPGDLPRHRLIPCFKPRDVDRIEDKLHPSTRFAILTDRNEPEPEVLSHLDANLERMPKRGRRAIRWMPPEGFAGVFPLATDAVLIPRIARTLRPIRLPAGTMPVNHDLVVVSGLPTDDLINVLNLPSVKAQADAVALRLEGGYHSYTTTILRNLIVPETSL